MAINLNGTGSITGLSSISSPTISGGSFPAGTAAAPGITLSGDSDTGLYSPGANQIAITTSGTAAVTIDASQRVGIGTASVSGGQLVINSTLDASNKQLVLRDATNGWTRKIGVDSSNKMAFYDGDTERVAIDGSGRLLVGTSSDSSSSTVVLQGTSASTSDPAVLRLCRGVSNPADGTELGYVIFGDSGHSTAASIISARDGGTWTSGSSQPTRLVFSTTADGASSPTERMRIRKDGTTTVFSDYGLTSCSSQSAGTTRSVFEGLHSATSTQNGTLSFRVFTNGNVVNTNNSYGAISDIKLKENIVDASSQWDDIKALRPVNYNFKEGQTHTQIGLIAQEVELVSPGLVSESPDRDEDGNDLGTVTKSVNYSVLYMKAVKALQEAMERIEQLETEMAAVKAQLA